MPLASAYDFRSGHTRRWAPEAYLHRYSSSAALMLWILVTHLNEDHKGQWILQSPTKRIWWVKHILYSDSTTTYHHSPWSFHYTHAFFLVFAVVKSNSYSDIWYVSRFSYRWQEKTDLVTSFYALHMCWALAPAGNSKRTVVSTAASTRYGEPTVERVMLTLTIFNCCIPTAWLWVWPHASARSISSSVIQDSGRK